MMQSSYRWWCSSCCTPGVRGYLRSDTECSSALVGTSRADSGRAGCVVAAEVTAPDSVTTVGFEGDGARVGVKVRYLGVPLGRGRKQSSTGVRGAEGEERDESP